jgi:hypothetical protein
MEAGEVEEARDTILVEAAPFLTIYDWIRTPNDHCDHLAKYQGTYLNHKKQKLITTPAESEGESSPRSVAMRISQQRFTITRIPDFLPYISDLQRLSTNHNQLSWIVRKSMSSDDLR